MTRKLGKNSADPKVWRSFHNFLLCRKVGSRNAGRVKKGRIPESLIWIDRATRHDSNELFHSYTLFGTDRRPSQRFALFFVRMGTSLRSPIAQA